MYSKRIIQTLLFALCIYNANTLLGQFKKSDTVTVNNLLKKSTELFYVNSDSAIILANEAKLMSENINFPTGKAYAFKNIGIVNYLKGSLLDALDYYQLSLRIFDSIGHKRGSANLLNNIGAIYFDKGDDTVSLRYHLQSLKLSQEINDSLRVATSLGNIGSIYSNKSSSYDKAMEYYRKALDITRIINDADLTSTFAANMGEVFTAQNKFDSAMKYYQESLNTCDDTEYCTFTLYSIGNLYGKRNNYLKAIEFLQKAYNAAKKHNNKLDIVRTSNSLANIYSQMGNISLALINYKQSETIGIEIDAKKELKSSYEGLSKLYASQNDYLNAYRYLSMLSDIKDSLYNKETDDKLSTLQFEFDIQKKQSEIYTLTQKQELNNALLKKERNFRRGLYIVLFLILVITIIQWRHIEHRKAASKKIQLQKRQTELEKEKAEKALHDLRQAEAQLIQSEKLAFLGELTAGIAHEIQNPLNFVNNFSEVSRDLLNEIKDAVEKGNVEDAKEIMSDVIQNLEKINHHGKRADGIVKGMLQHSRSSSGVKEPTDINALCDEYLRLAYHGLRAKDKSFNATMKTDFDASIGNINIIPQDIGRVILNLINNAFYAVDEKKKRSDDSYEPTVTITTSSIQPPLGGRGVAIKVSDNGGGIPQKVLDKIFQPFFTTKPTGQGTGLGLSLSYDIVKAHGGEIKVNTKENEGTEFIIQLPITQV